MLTSGDHFAYNFTNQHIPIRLLHVPTQTAIVGAFDGATLPEQQRWFNGLLEVHPSNMLPALAAGVRGDVGFNYLVTRAFTTASSAPPVQPPDRA